MRSTRLGAGGVDLLLTEPPLPRDRFDCCELLLDVPTLLVPTGSPLAERALPLAADDLTALALVAPRSATAAGRLADALRQAGARPRLVRRADEIATVHALVGAGSRPRSCRGWRSTRTTSAPSQSTSATC